MEKAKTIAVNVVLIAVIALLLIWGNTLYRQWSQYSRGEKAESAGDVISAIAGYESAIHMYTPGGPFIEPSAARLWRIGEMLEQQGDIDRALIAFRALRSAFYSTRGLAQPGSEWITRCDARIAPLAQYLKARQQQK